MRQQPVQRADGLNAGSRKEDALVVAAHVRVFAQAVIHHRQHLGADDARGKIKSCRGQQCSRPIDRRKKGCQPVPGSERTVIPACARARHHERIIPVRAMHRRQGMTDGDAGHGVIVIEKADQGACLHRFWTDLVPALRFSHKVVAVAFGTAGVRAPQMLAHTAFRL